MIKGSCRMSNIFTPMAFRCQHFMVII